MDSAMSRNQFLHTLKAKKVGECDRIIQAQPSIHAGISHIKQFLEKNFAVTMINGLNNLEIEDARSLSRARRGV